MKRRRKLGELLEASPSWPKAAVTHLPKGRQDAFKRNEGVILALRDTTASVKEVAASYKISRDEIYRLVDRATQKHPDGHIWGWRALVPYTQVDDYSRTKDLPSKRGTKAKAGFAGAFGALITRFETLEEWIRINFFRSGKDGQLIRKASVKKLHSKFLTELRRLYVEAGLTPAEHYPFNQRHVGRRSLGAFVAKLEKSNVTRILAWDSPALAALYARRTVDGSQLVATRPYEIVQADGHELALEVEIPITRPDGTKTTLVVPRLWLIAFMDVYSRSIIGYTVVPYENYNAHDVLLAAASALYGRPEKFALIPGSRYPGKSLPVELEPLLAGAGWDVLSLDNALAHLAKDVSAKMTEIVNCAICRGMPGVPEFRAYLERAFKSIQESGGLSHLAASRYGGRSVKPGTAINIEFLLPLIDGLIWEYNFETATSANYGRIPFEALMEAKDDPFLKKVGAANWGRSQFTRRRVIKKVRGNVDEGRPPFIEFEGARYAGRPLLERPDLIGQEVVFEYDEDDVLWANVYDIKGRELGRIKAGGARWGRRSHSLRLRRHIIQMINDGVLIVSESVDVITAWEHHVKSSSKPLPTRARAAATEMSMKSTSQQPAKKVSSSTPKTSPKPKQHMSSTSSGFKPVSPRRKGFLV